MPSNEVCQVPQVCQAPQSACARIVMARQLPVCELPKSPAKAQSRGQHAIAVVCLHTAYF
jgi:hypothetical protein